MEPQNSTVYGEDNLICVSTKVGLGLTCRGPRLALRALPLHDRMSWDVQMWAAFELENLRA
ncbi:hypothetical protein PanWU01x14_194610, partial [Parasponia andersonii]